MKIKKSTRCIEKTAWTNNVVVQSRSTSIKGQEGYQVSDLEVVTRSLCFKKWAVHEK
jgi:hypothetical protein